MSLEPPIHLEVPQAKGRQKSFGLGQPGAAEGGEMVLEVPREWNCSLAPTA